jgi:hypothetical protein
MMNAMADVHNPNPEGDRDRLTKSPHNQFELSVFMHYIERHLPAQGGEGP